MTIESNLRLYIISGRPCTASRSFDILTPRPFPSAHIYPSMENPYFGYDAAKCWTGFLYKRCDTESLQILKKYVDTELSDLLELCESWPGHFLDNIPDFISNNQLKFILKNSEWLNGSMTKDQVFNLVNDQVECETRPALEEYTVPAFMQSDSNIIIDFNLAEHYQENPDAFLDSLESADWERFYNICNPSIPMSLVDRSKEGFSLLANYKSTNWTCAQSRLLCVALSRLYNVPWTQIRQCFDSTFPIFRLLSQFESLRTHTTDILNHLDVLEPLLPKIGPNIDRDILNHIEKENERR